MSSNDHKEIARIDGSYGEGGGQILRTALGLSCILRRPLEIINIRKSRKKPGLQPQHLTAVKAAAAVSRAEIQGAELSSAALRFSPREAPGGEYVFDVSETRGSAGSTSLVLQTILPPLLFAPHPSQVTVIGGTHVPWSPPFHYLQQVFLPLLARIGATIELGIEKWGWYPIGGGRVNAHIHPIKTLSPLSITRRGNIVKVTGMSVVSNLPEDIARRQKNQAVNRLSQKGIDADIQLLSAPSPGKGTFLFLIAEFENISAGFGSLGAIGKRAEEVADEACDEFLAYLDGSGALDPHLADQVVPYLALAGGHSVFTTTRITQHLLTNIWVVKQFVDADVQVEGAEGQAGRVEIRGGAFSAAS